MARHDDDPAGFEADRVRATEILSAADNAHIEAEARCEAAEERADAATTPEEVAQALRELEEAEQELQARQQAKDAAEQDFSSTLSLWGF